MYGNRGPNLYLPQETEGGSSENDAMRDFLSGQFHYSGNQGIGGDLGLFGGTHNGMASHTIGRGPPPSADRRGFNSGLPCLPNHNMRIASMPQLLNEQGSVPLHHSVPDVAGMMAAMSLRQDQLEEENKLLKRDNNALHTRLASVELRAPLDEPTVPDAGSDPRLVAASRKKQATKRGRRRERGTDSEPHNEALAAASQLVRSGIYLGDTKGGKRVQEAKTATQKFVSALFRSTTGVGNKEPWPHPSVERVNDVTGEIYPTPNFDGLITDAHNQRLISLVARKAMEDLADEHLRPAELTNSQATWDYAIIEELARNSFSNFRPQWRKQNNPALAEKGELQKQFNRRRQRRVLKNDQKESVAKVFASKFKIPLSFVKNVLNETHESDEESGPEVGSGESFDTWKVRMAVLAGISVASPSALSKLQFVEVLEPEWRSSDFSNLGHAMHALWFDSLSAREKNSIRYIRVRGSGRTSRRIPEVAPWNFGISVPWLETNRLLDENQETLHDWNTYGNPPGFDDVDFTVFSNDS
ncbi:hypothetical protein R3P38DRAFT_959755 [Favolaschia claudopus]